jgi:hypothetical protein
VPSQVLLARRVRGAQDAATDVDKVKEPEAAWALVRDASQRGNGEGRCRVAYKLTSSNREKGPRVRRQSTDRTRRVEKQEGDRMMSRSEMEGDMHACRHA